MSAVETVESPGASFEGSSSLTTGSGSFIGSGSGSFIGAGGAGGGSGSGSGSGGGAGAGAGADCCGTFLSPKLGAVEGEVPA